MKENIPKSIYANYEIVEKEILGRTHYGAVRVIKLGPFKLKFKMKVDYYTLCNPRFNPFGGSQWHDAKWVIESAIKLDNDEREDCYVRKLLK